MALTEGIPQVVQDNLVFCLDPQNYRSYIGSGTSATDLSTNALTGTLTGGVGYSAPAWTHDGVNDYVDIGDQSVLENDDFSLCQWVKLGNTGATEYLTFCQAQWAGASDPCGWTLLRLSTDYFNLHVNIGGTWEFTNTTTQYTSTTDWYFVTATKSGTSVKMYVNGSADGTGTLSGSTVDFSTTSSKRTLIGCRWASGGPSFYTNADIGMTLIYHDELTSGEVLQNYNATKDIYL